MIKEREISEAFKVAAEVRHNKKKDYGGLEGYFPFGSKSFVHEINKKTMRLVNLVEKNEAPKYESIGDNLIDLINYASYYWEYLEGVKNE